jgi:chorismate mutase
MADALASPAVRTLFCYCRTVFDSAAYDKDGQQYSLLEYIMRETEQLHGKVRRYTSPDEHAFYAGQSAQQLIRPCI